MQLINDRVFLYDGMKSREIREHDVLEKFGVINSKNGFYEYKYLKEVFLDLSDNPKIKNGIFTVLTLDESIKTKVSTNRLALIIKNSVRADDIVGTAKGGKFFR